jgi:uncharacterized protein YjbI with pentapeptide repeats
MADSWLSCDQDGCSGACVAQATSCLAHAGTEERDATLRQFSQGGRLDVRDVTISESLLKTILDAAPHDEDGNPVFSAARFEGATFEGDARFERATFKGGVSFGGARFKRAAKFEEAMFGGVARFDGATFEGRAAFGRTTFQDAGFDRATFESTAWFYKATFKYYARFEEATFKSHAELHEAVFKGNAWFDRTTFEGSARFKGATFEASWFRSTMFKRFSDFRKVTFEGDTMFGWTTFEGDAEFHEAVFKDFAIFDAATFKDDARFDGATFKGDVRFVKATFEGDASILGPLVVEGMLNLDGTQFASPIQIEAVASALSCREVRFLAGVRFDVRRAVIRLDESDLSVPSLLTGPAVGDAAGNREQPKLFSLQRANVAGLALGNINLADCRFAGAHNLDKLRLEADTIFGLSPAGWGWERRQVIAEESAWRASRARLGRWIAPPWTDSGDQPEPLSPGLVAGLYRALRKGLEDAKDEPGAADFYYGEMEMRRHDHGTTDSGSGSRGRATRSVLFAYWLASGYGLRAWRSLTALAVVTALLAVAFHFVGFTRPPEPPSYWTSLLFAFRSTISLTDNQVELTAWGSFFQALLRITGPVLLALTLLAFRGRVKR